MPPPSSLCNLGRFSPPPSLSFPCVQRLQPLLGLLCPSSEACGRPLRMLPRHHPPPFLSCFPVRLAVLTGLSQRELLPGVSAWRLRAQASPTPSCWSQLILRTETNLWTNSRSLNETPILGCHLEPDRSVGHWLSPNALGQMIAGGDPTNISSVFLPLLCSSPPDWPCRSHVCLRRT